MTEKPNSKRGKTMSRDEEYRLEKFRRARRQRRLPGSPEDAVQDFRDELKAQGLKIDYDVGYGKPPKHTRFKPGVSGNPSGHRKKDRGLDMRAMVQESFLSEVSVRDGRAKRKRRPFLVALIMQKQKEALTDLKTFRELMRLAEKFGVFNLVRRPKRDYSDMTPEQREMAITAYHLMYKAGMVKDPAIRPPGG